MAVFPAIFGVLMAAFVSGQNVEITPREAVRRVGDDVTVLCRVSYPIDSCRMTVGSTSYRLIPNKTDDDVIYAGRGLNVGECGGHITRIREEWNGNVSCVLPPERGSIEVTGTMRLLVARPPGLPHLESSPAPSFREGEVFSARCVVPAGRPPANITWYLDDIPLFEGIHQPFISPEPGTDLQTISQNISRKMEASDDGKKLICRAEHLALDRPLEVARQFIVHYPPKRLEAGAITIFGLKLSAEGRLNVTVRANPPPEAEWTVGDQRLIAPQRSDDGSIVVLEPLSLGNGFYNVTLILSQIKKEDVERTYYLRVHNELGHEEFAVRISTMDEPAGVELGTGAIVGIVVAVLALLIAVFLVVFAKATDRWCFAGNNRGRENKSSGESSDTESAVGGQRSRLAALSARVRAALPRARDKVQATEPRVEDPHEHEDEKSEEKKGVVYAELTLADQTSGDKPPPPSTEYAEIVYTDQPHVKESKE